MNFTTIKSLASDLFQQAAFVTHIQTRAEYEMALALMDELIEDYDTYKPLIEILAASIEQWEDESTEFAEFNQRIEQLNDGVAVLRVLMDQYQLKAEDLKEDIGSKSLVSMILNGSRNLTLDHMQALAKRFKLQPAVFFSQSH
ncbi:MAG: helix-turn-helix domain-containing protein [Cellvibrionaceae bacterium]